MHGVRRALESTAEEEIKSQEKDEESQIDYYKGLERQVLDLNSPSTFDLNSALKLTADILELNTDWMTAWNLRKKALLQLWEQSSSPSLTFLVDEFAFSVLAIKTNPKSYGAWYHRRWLVNEIHKRAWPFDLNQELKLIAKLLDLDSRNFHCWNYRWFLFKTWSLSSKDEFDFTTQMIYKNFSNYSAWHRRSTLFPLLPVDEIASLVASDLEMVKSAYFTEPADQSSWFYLRWLIDFAIQKDLYKSDNLLREQLSGIEELLELEPDCGLALATWLHFARRLNLSKEKILPRLNQLISADPLRKHLWEQYKYK